MLPMHALKNFNGWDLSKRDLRLHLLLSVKWVMQTLFLSYKQVQNNECVPNKVNECIITNAVKVPGKE
jgi:hypothetical protein